MDLISIYSSPDKSMYYRNSQNDLKNIGFLSLRLALEKYFYSYTSIKEELVSYYEHNNISICNLDSIKYTERYYECCFEVIVHFQHFFELIIKDILEKESPLLSIKANHNHIILHKLIKGEAIADDDMEKLNSIEFSEALDRIIKLISDNRIDSRLKFIREKSNILKALNTFRNRTWHRGMFSLRYEALDEFVGKYILPLTMDIIKLEEYSAYEDIWKYSGIYIELDIITEIIREFTNVEVDGTKVALLKELGRASYIIKDGNARLQSEEEIENIIKYRNSLYGTTFSNLILNCEESLEQKVCPVCGKKSLMTTFNVDVDRDEICGSGGYMTFERPYVYEYNVECINCTFEINKYIKNLDEYGINFDDFWGDYEII